MSRKSLEFQWGYPAGTRIVDFEGMESAAIEPRSFVLIDTRNDQNRVGARQIELPAILGEVAS